LLEGRLNALKFSGYAKTVSFRTIRPQLAQIYFRVNTDNRITQIVCIRAANEKGWGKLDFVLQTRFEFHFGARTGNARNTRKVEFACP
jgi:hypothetical protein